MIISTNWLKEFTNITGTIDELTTLVGARLVEIEDVIDYGKKYDGVLIAHVVECRKLEGSDHLNVTKIDDGGVAQHVERDEKGLVQVVCGAPNVRAGLRVAWLPPGSTVPETHGDKEPFVLSARKLRGAMSNGMLASAKELDLFEDHTGILEINKAATPGTLFGDAYGLNDYLLDIENKSLTHRPDTFGIIGFAREVAAIQGTPFETPQWLEDTSPVFIEKQGDLPAPKVTIDQAELSARYQAVVLSGSDAAARSPLDIQTQLSRVGVRPINAVVDVTNYLMMLTGQPLHAFDYDKLIALNGGKAEIHVRTGHAGETLELLDGRTIELSESDIVIANGDTAVALAGAMGGAATEIDSATQNIILESATFNLYNLRNTQMRHGIFSEAITRFTKGQPAQLTAPVLAAAVKLLHESTGAKRASDVADSMSNEPIIEPIELTIESVNTLLGSRFAASDVIETLQNAEFTVATTDDNAKIAVIAPFWRSDIHIPEDVIEEIGRLNGFDSIEATLPARDFKAVSPSDYDVFKHRLRALLSRVGANEVLTYSFVHGDLLAKAGQDVAHSYRITNSISPDLQYYRLTLTPSVLQLIHPNSRAGNDEFALYELNKIHSKLYGVEDDVPKEVDSLALVYSAKKHQGAAYYKVKTMLDTVAQMLNMQLVYTPMDSDTVSDTTAPFEAKRSATVTDSATGKIIGSIGEYTTSVRRAFKLGDATAGFELDPRALFEASFAQKRPYTPLSRYPSSERDVCYRVDNDVRYAAIFDAATIATGEDIDTSIVPIDIYHEDQSAKKNVTLRFTVTPHSKTLTATEVGQIIDTINQSVIEQTGATIV